MSKLLARIHKFAQITGSISDRDLQELIEKVAFLEAMAVMPAQYEHKRIQRTHGDERIEERYKKQFGGKYDMHQVLDFFNRVYDELNTSKDEYWRYFPVPSKWAVRWPFEKNIDGKEFLGIFEINSLDNIKQPRFFWKTTLVDRYNNNGQGTRDVRGYLEPMLEKIKAGQVKMVTTEDFGRGRGKQIERAKSEKTDPLQLLVEMATKKVEDKVQRLNEAKSKAAQLVEQLEFAKMNAETAPPAEKEKAEQEALLLEREADQVRSRISALENSVAEATKNLEDVKSSVLKEKRKRGIF